MTTPTEWLTLDQAAVRLACSTRTVQRRVNAGELRAQRRDDGRTLVEVEAVSPCPTPVVAAEVVEQMQRQAEDTNRVAALAALASEQTAVAFRDRLSTVESALSDARSTARSWQRLASVAASVALASAVAVGFLVGDRAATGRQVSDMGSRLAETEDARRSLQDALQAVTEARQASDREVERLRLQAAAEGIAGEQGADGRRTHVAADGRAAEGTTWLSPFAAWVREASRRGG
jgi:excisionase family DNA binding protein